jgi:hypothetical protein
VVVYAYSYAVGAFSGISGSGTTNYLPKFTGASTIGDSVIQEASSNIGIGVSPSYKLDVNGTTRFIGTASSDTAPLGSELAAVTGTGTNWTLAGTNLNVGGYTHTVGSVVPLTTALAAVNGTYYQIAYTITGRTAGTITIGYGGTSTSGITATGATGPLASSTAVLTITPTTDFDGTVVLSIKTIGTSIASSTFANSASTSNIELRASSLTNNTFIGLGSGRRNTTGANNTFLGNNAGQNNTTGNSNTLIGAGAGAGLSTGINNTFIGNGAGSGSVTGSGNVAVGGNNLINLSSGTLNIAIASDSALGLLTTGSNNIAFGRAALFNITTSGSNIAFGNNAGRFIANGSTAATSIDASILIGDSTKVLANGQTNQIVIGSGSTGLGSNTTVIGNSSTVTTALYGNLLLGTTTDSGFKLQVDGEGRFYQPSTTLSAYLRVENNRARNAAVRLKTTVGDYYIGTGIGADVNQFQIFDGNASETRLTIASTGAATFSSSVTAKSFSVVGTNGYSGQIIQQGDIFGTAATNLLIQSSTGNSIGFLTNGGTSFNMFINTSGNVGIGTSIPSAILHTLSSSSNGGIIATTSATTLFTEYRVNTSTAVGYIGNGNGILTGGGNTNFGVRSENDLLFAAGGNSERIRITSGGVIQINGGNYYNGAGSVNTTVSSASEFCYSGANTNDSNPRGVFISLPNSAAGDFAYYLASNAATKFYVNGNGAIYSTSTSITLISSDYNLKTDIKDYDKGLAEILAMKPRYFKYKDNLEEEKIGFIAQEMEQALAGSMIDVPTGLDTGEFHKSYQIDWYPLLVKAIQEQQAQIEAQQQQINSLINR